MKTIIQAFDWFWVWNNDVQGVMVKRVYLWVSQHGQEMMGIIPHDDNNLPLSSATYKHFDDLNDKEKLALIESESPCGKSRHLQMEKNVREFYEH